MLDRQTIQNIESFVYPKPRSIQEIANHLNKNWRTVDRYIEEIINEYGTINKRIFREGTRGALKIIYWASIEKISHTVFQEELEKTILLEKNPADFSAFDIFQHVTDSKKNVWGGEGKDEVEASRLSLFENILNSAKKQVLFFSGNLSFINYKDKKSDILKVIEGLVKKGISIKIVCKADVAGKENIEKLLSLNFKYGRDLIEIRHRKQPLRATIIDGKLVNIKEIVMPKVREGEFHRKLFIFYTIKDKEWVDWLTRIFWKMFSNSIGSEKRLTELNKLSVFK